MKSVIMHARKGWVPVALLTAMGLGFWMSVGPVAPAAAQMPAEKLIRQIDVMETILGEVLVDSENLVVSGRSPVHGVFLDGYGVLFSFDASTTGGLALLTEPLEPLDLPDLDVLDRLHMKFDNGQYRIWFDDEDSTGAMSDEELEYRTAVREHELQSKIEAERAQHEAEAARAEAEQAQEEAQQAQREMRQAQREARNRQRDVERDIFFVGRDGESIEKWREKRSERQRERYAKGKEELTEALIDYGDTLTLLGEQDWVAIAAFFRTGDFIEGRDITRLVIKARMSDLRAFGQDRISRDAMLARVSVEEY